MYLLSEGSFRRVRGLRSVGEVNGPGTRHKRAQILRQRVSDPLLSRLLHRLHLPQFERLYQFHMGEDCVKWFVDEIRQFEKEAMGFYYDEKRLQWDNHQIF